MQKFVARLWVTGIVAVVILIQLTWILLVMTANDIRHFSHVTVFLFPVLFIIGIISHFRFRNT